MAIDEDTLGEDDTPPAERWRSRREIESPQERMTRRLSGQFGAVGEDRPYYGPSMLLPVKDWIEQSKALTASRIATAESARAADSADRKSNYATYTPKVEELETSDLLGGEAEQVEPDDEPEAVESVAPTTRSSRPKSERKTGARESAVSQPYDVEDPVSEAIEGVSAGATYGFVPSGAEFDTTTVPAEDFVLGTSRRIPRNVRLGGAVPPGASRPQSEIEASAAAALSMEGDIGVPPSSPWIASPEKKKKRKSKGDGKPFVSDVLKRGKTPEPPKEKVKFSPTDELPTASEINEANRLARDLRAQSASSVISGSDAIDRSRGEHDAALAWYRQQSATRPVSLGNGIIVHPQGPVGSDEGLTTDAPRPTKRSTVFYRPRRIGPTSDPFHGAISVGDQTAISRATTEGGVDVPVTVGITKGGVAKRRDELLSDVPGLAKNAEVMQRLAINRNYLDEDVDQTEELGTERNDENRPGRMVFSRASGRFMIPPSIPEEGATEKVKALAMRKQSAVIDPDTGAPKTTTVVRPGFGSEMTPEAAGSIREDVSAGREIDPYAVPGGVADITAGHMRAVSAFRNRRESGDTSARPPSKLATAALAAELVVGEQKVIDELMEAPARSPKRGSPAAGVGGTGERVRVTRPRGVPDPSATAQVRGPGGRLIRSPYRSAQQVPVRGGATAIERARSMGLIAPGEEVTEEKAAGMVRSATQAARESEAAKQTQSRRAALEINAGRIDAEGNLIEGRPAPIPPTRTGSTAPTNRGGRGGEPWSGVPATRAGRLAWRRPRTQQEPEGTEEPKQS